MKYLLLIAILVLINSLSFAHLCHDPFRPRERLVLIPEKDLIRIEEEGEFRIYIENTFFSTLRDVQLFVKNPALEIQVEPPVLKSLLPGERAFFLIKLKLKEGFTPGDYPLRISVSARGAELKPTVESIDVAIEKKEPRPKIEEKIILPPEEKPTPPTTPPKEEVPPIEERPLEPQREKIEVLPEKKLPLPSEKEVIEPQEEVVKPQVEKEEVQQEDEVVVRVEKIPFWKQPYFYIILISLLLGILIWRKIKK